MIVTPAIWTTRLLKLPAVRKLWFFDQKKIVITASPNMTGRIPTSPARSRSMYPWTSAPTLSDSGRPTSASGVWASIVVMREPAPRPCPA